MFGRFGQRRELKRLRKAMDMEVMPRSSTDHLYEILAALERRVALLERILAVAGVVVGHAPAGNQVKCGDGTVVFVPDLPGEERLYRDAEAGPPPNERN